MAVGREAGSVTQGSYSVAVGPSAGFTSQQSRCVAVGAYAGYQQQGQNAISIGHRAGYIHQGAGSIAIGFSAGLNKQAANSIVISAAGFQVDNTVPNSCIITPIRNLNAPSDQRLYYSPNGTAEITSGGDSVSSIRYKQDVIELPRRYIDAVFDLKPVEFEFKTDSRKRTIGLIAEDVLEHIPEIVMFNALDDTVVEGLEIDRLVAPLVAIAQQHEIRINTLRDQLLQCNALVQQGDDKLESDKFSIT